MRVVRVAGFVVALAGLLGGGGARADPMRVYAAGDLAGTMPADDVPADAVTVTGPGGTAARIGADALAALPRVSTTVAYETDAGPRRVAFEGPLLWDVLVKAGAVDPAAPRKQVRQIVLLEGRDRYTAALALGELAPDFEGKQVILADRMDGAALPPEHWRIVVPGDRRGGRNVRDVARIAVLAAPPPPPR
jgi:DMSO/TMAO reductase YedYZ molybdopterin-dependent catalytic subunit